MAPSSPPDRLAKALHPFLTAKVSVPELKSLGWFDFLNNDRPETNDVVEMSAAAFMYLTVDDAGSWNGQVNILTGIIAFLNSRTGKKPGQTDLTDLKSLLSRPVQQGVIRDWFERVYR
jgi:hypothetical protein